MHEVNLKNFFFNLFEQSQIDLSSVMISDTKIVFNRFVTFFISLGVQCKRSIFHEMKLEERWNDYLDPVVTG
jgi:hypothetical protein